MLRTGLETLVRAEPDMELAAVAEAFEDVRARAAEVTVVLDADLDALPAGGCVVSIVPQVEPRQLRTALRAGVRAVLPQECSAAELAAAIAGAAAGLVCVRYADVEGLSVSNATAEPPVSLSPRELEVLRLLADGLANKEISFRLGISEHTVKFHVNSILTRMDAATRAEAVAIGMRQGLILL